MREIERQRRLRISAAFRADAGRGAAERALSVGADHKPHARRAVIELDGDARGIAIDGDGRPADARDLQLRRARIKRREQMPVLDIVAEGVEADVRGGEGDFRRAKEPLRVVDDADGNERRGMRQAVLPYAERRQRGDRAGE